MSRKNPLPIREVEICRRLREFRLGTKLSQVAFAKEVGLDSARLASYEHGRAPLRIEVFLAVHQKYFLNPVWLATGEEHQAYDAPIVDWGRIMAIAIPRRWLFTEAYDRALERFCKDRNRLADVLAGRIVDSVSQLMNLAKEQRSIPMRNDIAFRIRARLKDLDTLLESFSQLGLTVKSKYRKSYPVPLPTLRELLEQTRELVRPAGMKAALASYLLVPQSRVSEWLGGKHRPSGEVTLKILKWVSDPERKQNTLGSAMNTAKGKVTRGQKSYETKPSSSRKTK
jgi:transcriptional regulator with XRE-family HTH domain